jgi:hypothetical protein
MDSITLLGSRLAYHNLSLNAPTDLPIDAHYRLGGNTARDLSFRVPPLLITIVAVQEYQPVVHRLRLTPSP